MKIIRKDDWICQECGALLKMDQDRPNILKHPDVACAYRGMSMTISPTMMDVRTFKEP